MHVGCICLLCIDVIVNSIRSPGKQHYIVLQMLDTTSIVAYSRRNLRLYYRSVKIMITYLSFLFCGEYSIRKSGSVRVYSRIDAFITCTPLLHDCAGVWAEESPWKRSIFSKNKGTIRASLSSTIKQCLQGNPQRSSVPTID